MRKADEILPKYYLDGDVPIPDDYWSMHIEDLVRPRQSSWGMDYGEAVHYAEEHNKQIKDFSIEELLMFIVGEYDFERHDDEQIDQKIDELVEKLLDDTVRLVDKQDDAKMLNWLLELRKYRRENR